VRVNLVVSVSDLRTSADPADTLVTYSLGSCIGVAAYDPVAHIGALLHFQLPSASLDAGRAVKNPLMFADSGVQCLLEQVAALGGQKKRLRIKLAGAAQMLNDNNLFNIGRRNHAAVRKVLWQHGLFIDGEDIGGTTPRNVYLTIADGTVTIKAQGSSAVL
jgi:chemotaxis protein CheD